MQVFMVKIVEWRKKFFFSLMNLIQDGGVRILYPTRFSPETSKLLQTLELAPKTVWLLVLILLPYWYKII